MLLLILNINYRVSDKVLTTIMIIFSGAVLVRKLRRLPQSKCWLVGYAKTDAVETATEFNRNWETNLKIGVNDCRDYTNGNI